MFSKNNTALNLFFFFIALYPLLNFILPSLIYLADIKIRVYEIGTYFPSDALIDSTFKENKNFSINQPQGTVYQIEKGYLFLAILYFFIFIFTTVFVIKLKNRSKFNFNNLISYSNKRKVLLIFFSLFYILSYKLLNLKIYSNFFINLNYFFFLVFSIISMNEFVICKIKIKKIFIAICYFSFFIYLADFYSSKGHPTIFEILFLTIISSFLYLIFLSISEKKLIFLPLIKCFFILFLLMLTLVVWKINKRSNANYNFVNLEKKMRIYNTNLIYKGDNFYLNLLSRIIEQPINRINKIDQFGYILSIQEKKYLLGKSYYPLVGKLIPRLLWKNKPSENFGNQYGRQFKFIPSYDYSTSVNPSTLIESYINFSFFGIILLGLTYGLIVRLSLNLSNYFQKKDPLISYLILSNVLLLFLSSESNFSLGFGGFLQILFIIFLYYLINKKIIR